MENRADFLVQVFSESNPLISETFGAELRPNISSSKSSADLAAGFSGGGGATTSGVGDFFGLGVGNLSGNGAGSSCSTTTSVKNADVVDSGTGTGAGSGSGMRILGGTSSSKIEVLDTEDSL